MQMRRSGSPFVICNYNCCSYAIKHQVDRLIKFCADYTLFTYTKYDRTCNVSSRYLQVAHRIARRVKCIRNIANVFNSIRRFI